MLDQLELKILTLRRDAALLAVAPLDPVICDLEWGKRVCAVQMVVAAVLAVLVIWGM